MIEIFKAVRLFSPEEVEAAVEIADEYLNYGPGEYHIYVKKNAKNKIIGLICYGKASLSKDVFDLYWIVVHPAFQRKKAGTELLNFAEGKVRKLGGKKFLAETSSGSDYKKSRTFYNRRGYRKIAKIPDYYSKGDDKIIFAKNLSPR